MNTAGAVPGEASVARNIARSSSLREPGCLVIVAPVVFSNRGPLSNLRPRYVCNGLTNSYKLQVDSFVKALTTTKIPIRVNWAAMHGFNEQIFGAKQQVFGRRRRHLKKDVRYCDPLSCLPHACADRTAHRHNQICITTKHILSALVPSMQEVALLGTEGCVGTQRRQRLKICRRVTPRQHYLANNLLVLLRQPTSNHRLRHLPSSIRH